MGYDMFKVGDIIIGLPTIPAGYTTTDSKTKVLVSAIVNNRYVEVKVLEGYYKGRGYTVEAKYFRLYEQPDPRKQILQKIATMETRFKRKQALKGK